MSAALYMIVGDCRAEDAARLFSAKTANAMDSLWDWLHSNLWPPQPAQLTQISAEPLFQCLEASASWLSLLCEVEQIKEPKYAGLHADVKKAARNCVDILLQRGAAGKLMSAIATVCTLTARGGAFPMTHNVGLMRMFTASACMGWRRTHFSK